MVHLSLFFLAVVAKRADLESAKKFHSACLAEAEIYDSLVDYFLAIHVLSFFICMYREIFTSEVGLSSLLLTLIQMLLIPAYMYSLLIAH